MYCRCTRTDPEARSLKMYIIENDYRNYRIFRDYFCLGIFEYKSFEITVIQIGIPEDLIESTLWKVTVKVLPLLPAIILVI